MVNTVEEEKVNKKILSQLDTIINQEKEFYFHCDCSCKPTHYFIVRDMTSTKKYYKKFRIHTDYNIETIYVLTKAFTQSQYFKNQMSSNVIFTTPTKDEKNTHIIIIRVKECGKTMQTSFHVSCPNCTSEEVARYICKYFQKGKCDF